MIKPTTQYTKSGQINIAYQVIGSGSVDLIYVPGWISNIDLMWRDPHLNSFLHALSNHARLILFDKRGTGLSDRVTELSTLEERMDDIRAVMDAVDSEKAILFGHSEGGSVCALFAATYPHRTISLITFGVFAKRRYSKDYPWAPTDEERQKVYDNIESSWGTTGMDLASLAPSMAQDEVFMDWLATYFRSGASPSAALVLTKMNTQVDIIDILENIDVPTLLIYRTDDIDVKVEEGRFIHQRIAHSKFVEFPGQDHLFWVGNAQVVLDEMLAFIQQRHPDNTISRVLATILKLKVKQEDIDGEGPISAESLNQLERLISQYRGKLINEQSGIFTATFDGPSKAVHCAMAIRNILELSDICPSQAIHIGECIINGNHTIIGNANDAADKIIDQISTGDIVVSNTVNSLLSGAGLEFEKCDVQFDEMPLLLRLKDTDRSSENLVENVSLAEMKLKQSHSILENVLLSIENHISNESLGVDTICLEVGVSERQLQRKLKQITNKSPNQLIRSVRLNRARHLIQHQKHNISEAAFQTGFSSLSYFTKCFRSEFGYTPSEIKN